MLQKIFLIICFSATIALSGCSHKLNSRHIKKLLNESPIINDHFTGFALYDLDKDSMIYTLNADKYFTPASNTKLFTFYTCLKMLGDSIPGLRYVTHGDSLLFWGTGDPSFLHPDLKGVNAYKLLSTTSKKMFFCSGQYVNDLYGNGWAWNDYNDYYQAEINELPIGGNLALFYADDDCNLQVKPTYMKRFLKPDSSLSPRNFFIKRDFLDNVFEYPQTAAPTGYKQEIPWKTSTALTLDILRDTLKRQVTDAHIPLPADAKIIYNAPADTVYKHMLQPSDNFIAEQLLLVCASTKFKTLNTDSVKAYAIKTFLADLPDKPQWADGSGLSRLNLFTPRSIIALLIKIRTQVNNDELLHSLLPAGGMVGTIRTAYKTDNGAPFIWAKTGSLSNNYNQSGYLITAKGKRLAFCFMNNNFTRPTRQIRDEMVRIMTYIHQNF
jgi:D-alanyl-D-alanine carboxypeptidase/D-alanyl-D-alanine-endopeptidase (penicillin-binding protein 4)